MLLANVAGEKITPTLGTCLFGYRPGVESTSVHDDIHVHVLVFAQEEKKAVIVNAEVCLIAEYIMNDIRRRVSAITGADFADILVETTHTHSAPNVSGQKGWGEVDADYLNGIFLPAIEKAAQKAVAGLQPVKLGVATYHSLIGVNRREVRRDLSVQFGQTPWGSFDPKMTVISAIHAETGKQVFNLVHYGCHGTAAGCNHEITRDWPGGLIDALEEKYGGIALFVNGAQGDVGPRISNGMTTGNISYVEELAAVAARDGLAARALVTEYRDDVRLSVLHGKLTIPCKPVPALAEAKAAFDAFVAAHPDPEALTNIDGLEYNHLKDVLELRQSGEEPEKEFVFDQSILLLGDIAFVPFPFEVFSGITQRLAKFSPFAHTLSLSNCNGANFYLPDEEALCRGGYEVGLFQLGRRCPLVDDADTRIVEENLKILEK